MIEISPNEKYFITYSEEGRSIVGWNGKDIDKVQLKFHQAVKTNEDNEDNEDKKYEIKSLCVSDDRKLAYINSRRNNFCNTITVIDMSYCAFNLKGKFILYSKVYRKFKIQVITFMNGILILREV
ncbi:hypothetical protein RhiirA4_469465 [Rhizophagus irregularis]|uniref:Uncharacterized protein n=1 Tax=Rhizophagus irregularis TaxID=588596 RepID=A0A2I1GZK6_9GLOM|nr:hypothetical protein RhiirA4_469465 [Rhizophagus irregularis]